MEPITKKRLIPSEIDFLNHSDYLYSIDFRAISENMDYKIPAMRKYENLFPWILEKRHVVVNKNTKLLQYPKNNQFLTVKHHPDPRISVYKRLTKNNLNKEIKKLWVSVPHPDADIFCKINNLDINYTFTDFLKLNNKLIQKKLLKDRTPPWQIISSQNDLKEITSKSTGYIKRITGSGGYTVFKVNELNDDFNSLFAQSPKDWFWEKEIKGKSYSIQCVKDESGKITIFGYGEQIVEDYRFYVGSRILPLKTMNSELYNQLEQSIKMLNKLLKNYTGFFGLDFIVDTNDHVFILEANMRLTAATIPTLLSNMIGDAHAIYKEDVNLNKIIKSDLVLTRGEDKTSDILQFTPNND